MNTKNNLIQHPVQPESKLDKIMESGKFEQIVTAILDGKYSWACVLILRFAGYNPLHYIPYRTYNRLVKNNSQRTTFDRLQADRLDRERESVGGEITARSAFRGDTGRTRTRGNLATQPLLETTRTKSSTASLARPSYKLEDLSYLEVVSQQDKSARGGNRVSFGASIYSHWTLGKQLNEFDSNEDLARLVFEGTLLTS